METKYGFTKMNLDEFKTYLKGIKVARTVLRVQQHHTYSPSYAHFKGTNQFSLQKGMKNYHVNQNGWSDIGQHFSTFPDGSIVTGRSLERSPACIFGANANSICIENVGNFDQGADNMTDAHKELIVGVTAALCERFGLAVDTQKIIYHHWFNLSTGTRNNGTGGNKSCPGTNFFGGNSVSDCETNLLPLIKAAMRGTPNVAPVLLKYVIVTANLLNIRSGPSTRFKKVANRHPASLGAILRIFKIKNGWFKISNSQEHWVSGRYTRDVQHAIITTDSLNIRSGPGTNYQVVNTYCEGEEAFIEKVKGNWAKVAMEDKWVHKDYLKFTD